MNTLNNASLNGKRVLVRVDFNVPLDKDFRVTDTSRISAALPTIKRIISDGGMAIIMSHLGRPKSGYEKKFSLKNIVGPFSNLLGSDVTFGGDCIGTRAISSVKKMTPGDVVLLENLRFHPEEQKGEVKFAKKLAGLADIYVNDAFGTSHRPHASTAIVAQFFPNKKYLGFLLEKEIRCLDGVLNQPKRPLTAIIGGAKITGKIDVIKSLYSHADNLIIGGGMAYTFVKASGGDVGKSLVEEEKIVLAKQLIAEAKQKGVNLVLPKDSVNASEFKNDAIINTSDISLINKNYMGLDIGAKSIVNFSKIIANSKTIIWNGPMGVFEMDSFENGTRKIGEAVCLATTNGAFSLVGGGDSIAAIKKFNLFDKTSYVSTGGGAMLEYLEGKILPGITAILN